MEYLCIVKIKKYIEENFTEDISLNDIAKMSGYSKYHLNRIFLEKTGQTIHNYIMERRLFEASKLLVDSDFSLVEIALMVGYTSQQSFTRAFKQMFGATPMTYRKDNITCIDRKCVELHYKSSSYDRKHITYSSEVMSA